MRMSDKIKLIIPFITSVVTILFILIYLVSFDPYKDSLYFGFDKLGLLYNLIALTGILISIIGIVFSAQRFQDGEPKNRILWGIGFVLSLSSLFSMFLIRVLISGFHISCFLLCLPFSLLFLPAYLIMLLFFFLGIICLLTGFKKGSKPMIVSSRVPFALSVVNFLIIILPDILVLIFR